jgi:beta-lactam-binding protein with PASTA domain
MQLFKFLFSKAFIINLLIALFLVSALIFGVVKWLDTYTHHGESITVPDLNGMSLDELNEFLPDKDLKFEITDSVFVADAPKGVVLEQNPKPESQVKKGRTIYITVTKKVAPQIFVPDVIDMSVRMATAKLQSIGIKVGELVYRPANCLNCIVGLEYNGKEITPNAPVKKGSTVNLIVGSGMSNEKIPVPYVIGLTIEQAKQKLLAGFLNIGAELYENCPTAADSSKAKIYKQYPERAENTFIPMGSSVDIWLTCDSTKIQIDSLKLLGLDSINVNLTDTLK